jgi:hypothetical protein
MAPPDLNLALDFLPTVYAVLRMLDRCPPFGRLLSSAMMECGKSRSYANPRALSPHFQPVAVLHRTAMQLLSVIRWRSIYRPMLGRACYIAPVMLDRSGAVGPSATS